ncbi:MAG: CotH kinase family protein, partial [Actinomycetota bacterium]|nr:CotH kinase family protein [Actinomycetota bacterium]
TIGPTRVSDPEDRSGSEASASHEGDRAGDGQAEPHPSDHLFDQELLHTFELTVEPELLAQIDADPTAEEYVEAQLTFEGETIPVGLRYKGSVGAFIGCVDGPNPFEPSGSKTCTKLSMKVKVNWDDPDDELHGVRRLQLHSLNLDPSLMHERLGYWLFGQMGVPAPRAVHARVTVNGEFVGLFALVEQIDGRFVRHRFEDGTGNLYKEVWPVDVDGQPHPESVYLDGLRTNEDDDPSARIITAFARGLANGPDEAQAALDRYANVSELLAYSVVDRTIRHDDGPFHWYCATGPCITHNFYWYEDPSAERLHLIAWDLDNAFQNIRGPANPITPIADAWGFTQGDCEPFAYGTWQLPQRSAACGPLVGALVAYDAEYDELLDAFLSGPFAEEQVEAQLTRWSTQIDSTVAQAAAAHDDALTVDGWNEALAEFRADLAHARGR